jgi:hypothetical protein
MPSQKKDVIPNRAEGPVTNLLLTLLDSETNATAKDREGHDFSRAD